jgi:hypothetical protein
MITCGRWQLLNNLINVYKVHHNSCIMEVLLNFKENFFKIAKFCFFFQDKIITKDCSYVL